MADTIIENAIIIKADIHRIVSKESGLNLSLGFDYGIHKRTKEFPKIIYRKVPTWRWIMRCMEVAHASKWSDMKGKTVKVKIKDGAVEAVGDIIENWSWLDFSEKKESAIERAKDFLYEVLSSGGVSSFEVEKKATSAGIKKTTLRRAKKELGVVAKEDRGENGKIKGWVWTLPDSEPRPRRSNGYSRGDFCKGGLDKGDGESLGQEDDVYP